MRMAATGLTRFTPLAHCYLTRTHFCLHLAFYAARATHCAVTAFTCLPPLPPASRRAHLRGFYLLAPPGASRTRRAALTAPPHLGALSSCFMARTLSPVTARCAAHRRYHAAHSKPRTLHFASSRAHPAIDAGTSLPPLEHAHRNSDAAHAPYLATFLQRISYTAHAHLLHAPLLRCCAHGISLALPAPAWLARRHLSVYLRTCILTLAAWHSLPTHRSDSSPHHSGRQRA